jgi:hypothetical protein
MPVGYIEKRLPSFDSFVTVRWGNVGVDGGTVKLWVGGNMVKEAIRGETDITTTVPFKSEDLFRLEEVNQTIATIFWIKVSPSPGNSLKLYVDGVLQTDVAPLPHLVTPGDPGGNVLVGQWKDD